LEKSEKMLEGRRVVVTRARRHAGELVQALEVLGAEVLLLPMIEASLPETWEPLDRALKQLSQFDAVVFVSKIAVNETYKRAQRLRLADELRGPSVGLIAAVGPGTAQAATEHGLRVGHVATDRTGEGLARELGDKLAGRRVLMPRGNRGDERLPNALREAGANVTEVVVYKTVLPETPDPVILSRIRSGDVDAIVFASPSALTNLSEFIEARELAALSSDTQFAAIGPTTAKALRNAGIRVEIEASEPTTAGLVEAIANYYRPQESEARHG